MMLLKSIHALSKFLFIFVWFLPLAWSNTSLKKSNIPSVLRVGVDATFAPLEYFENEQRTGFDVELVESIAQVLQISTIEWVDLDFKGLIPGLLANRFDMVASGVYITEERKRVVEFSDTYLPGGMVAVVAQNSKIQNPSDLSEATIAFQTGTKSAQHLEVMYPRAHFIEVEKNAEMFLLVESGRADAVVTAFIAAKNLVQVKPNLRIIEPPLTTELYGFAFRKESHSLALAVNQALHELKNNGKYTELVTRWFKKKHSEVRSKIDFKPVFTHGRKLVHGTWVTLQITFLSLLFSIFLGFSAGIARVYPDRKITYQLASIYILVIRGTPLLVQLFLLFFGLPQCGISLPASFCAILGLSVYSGAYLAEVVRGAILSIDSGQFEASRAMGFTDVSMLRFIILPQAIPRMMPGISNEVIALIKNSALASLLTIDELMREGQRIISFSYRSLEVYIVTGFIYFVIIYSVSKILKQLENSMKSELRL